MNTKNSEKESPIQSQTSKHSEEEFDIWNLAHLLFEEKILIAIITLSITFIGIAYAINATPIYRTDALLQVEEKKPTMQGLDDISAVFGGGVPAVTEIEIIRSRSIIGTAVDDLRLEVIAWPQYFPYIGEIIARGHQRNDVLAKPFLGLSGYPWGGESVEIKDLSLPRKFVGKLLLLKVLENDRFKISDEDGIEIIEGKVGRLSTGSTNDGVVASIFVQNLMARPGVVFYVVKRSRAALIKDLQSRINVREKGRKTGILELYMEGADPASITKTLNTIANAYVRKNAERRSAEAQSTLQFLNGQLPILKENLDKAESNLNNYRSRTGKVNLTFETQSLLDSVIETEKKVQEFNLKISELKQRFTRDHPTIIGINQKINRLNKKKSALTVRIKALPEAEQSSIQLMRDVKVANELYVLLLNKAQELKVVKAGTIGNVRILDEALIPEFYIKPKKRRIAVLSLFIGFIFSIGIAALKRNLMLGMDDPNAIEGKFGLPVYASIIHSDKLRVAEKDYESKKRDDLPILANIEKNDSSIEALRSFRTSLQFTMMEAKNNIIAISGPSPAIGKSFISVNLPFVLADTSKTVLVIDGDMRRGHIHRYFSAKRTPGLSEYVSGSAEIKDVIRQSENNNVSYISSGDIPPNPSELLTSDRFKNLLDDMSAKYDVVLVDTPPVLAVTDGIIISHLAGAVFLVLKSGQHRSKEIENMLRRLSQNNITPSGFLLNNVPTSALGRYGYKYNYYNYKY